MLDTRNVPRVTSPTDNPAARPVLSRDQALTLGHRLLDLASDQVTFRDFVGVRIEHVVRTMTKVANGRVLHTNDGDSARISFASNFGVGLPVEIRTNQLQDETLRRVVEYARTLAPTRPKVLNPELVGYQQEVPATYGPREFPPVALWHETSVRAMSAAREDVLASLVEQVQSAKLIAATTVGITARSILYLYKHGLTAFADETDCELTVTARSPDGTASGWGGQAHRDWARLSPNAVAAQAIRMANMNRAPVAVEPGRRVAILGPDAVAQLVHKMSVAFDWDYTDMPPGQGTPFTFGSNGGGRRTRFGLRVFDPRIMMTSDPADPDGGYAPFFEAGGKEFSILGFPTPAITWIDHGVLTHFAYAVLTGLGREMAPCNWPESVRLSATPGTKTATIEEMIANCQDGVYVHRFSGVELIDMGSGMMTGTTRDGCFLVRNGRIEKPIKNFRFLDSPFLGLNRLEAIGTPERVAMGENTDTREKGFTRWPRLPVIVPPLMIRDFNFNAMVDAI